MVTERTTRLCIASSLPREPCSKPPAPAWRRQAPQFLLCTDPEVRAHGSGAQLPWGHSRGKGLKQISYVKAKAGTGATRQLQGLQIAQECSNATPGTRHAYTQTRLNHTCAHMNTHIHTHTCARMLVHTLWCGVPQARGRPPHTQPLTARESLLAAATVPGAAPVRAPWTRSPPRLRAAPLSSGQRS